MTSVRFSPFWALFLAICLIGSAVAQSPTLSVNPTSISFGSINVGSSASKTFTITNPSSSTSGTTTTTVNFDNPAPSGARDSALNGTFQGINFGSGQWYWGGAYASNTTNNIYFAAQGQKSASLSFSTPKVLQGLSVVSTVSGTLTLTDNLGQTVSSAIGTTAKTVTTGWTKASTTVNVSFTGGWNAVFDNIQYASTGTGSGTSVTINSGSVSSSTFKLSGISFPLTLSPGQSATATVSCAPTAAGSLSASVSLASTASNSPATVSLTATGVTTAGQLAANPASVSFGSVNVGARQTASVQISNKGNASLTVSQATETGTAFSISGLTLPVNLAAGSSATFSAVFAPTTAGTATGNIQLVNSASSTPVNIPLSGTATAPTQSHSVTLTWTASSSSDVTGYNVYRSSTSGGSYGLLTTSPVSGGSFVDTTVAAGQTYYYVVTSVSNSGESVYSNVANATVPQP